MADIKHFETNCEILVEREKKMLNYLVSKYALQEQSKVQQFGEKLREQENKRLEAKISKCQNEQKIKIKKILEDYDRERIRIIQVCGTTEFIRDPAIASLELQTFNHIKAILTIDTIRIEFLEKHKR